MIGIFTALGGIYHLGSRLLRPTRYPITRPPADLPIDTITFKAEDGLTLSGWLVRHPEPKAGLLLMHGSGQNREIMLSRARFLYDAGYTSLLFDFRGHGESEGTFRTFGLAEHLDARAALNVLKSLPEIKQTAVIGFSLGGAASILGEQPLSSDAFILEAVFPDIRNAIANRIRLKLGAPYVWATGLLSYQIPLRTGTRLDELRPIENIGNIQAPTFIIAGGADQRATAKESRQLFEAAGAEKKDFWVIPSATHTNFHAVVPKSYEQRVLSFLAAALEEPEPDSATR